MPTPDLPPTTTLPKRKALHERTGSQTNEQSPTPTLRLVNDQDDTDIYSATPYPTKPEHVLLPKPVKGKQQQGFVLNSGAGVSDVSFAASTASPSSDRDYEDDGSFAKGGFQEDGNVTDSYASEISSTVNAAYSSTLTFGDEYDSSQTTIPDHYSRAASQEKRGGSKPLDDGRYSSNELVVLPPSTPTIKTVAPESSSPVEDPGYSPTASESGSYETSSPNIVAHAFTSSPNFVPLQSSSPNIVSIGSSSPNFVVAKSSDSSLSSSDSQGTVRRHSGVRQWDRLFYSRFPSRAPSELSRSPSFPSSPPGPPLSYQRSISSAGLHSSESSSSRPATSSTRSLPSTSDVQAVISSGTPVQYPVIRPPSSAGSWAESSDSLAPRRSLRSMTNRASGRWNPHLSTVPSEWSGERQASLPSPRTLDRVDEPGLSGLARIGSGRFRRSRTTEPEVGEEQGEHTDSLTALWSPRLREKTSGILRQQSSRGSLRSLGRPSSSSSSLIVNTLPAWARVYYKSGAAEFQASALSLIQGSRASSINSFVVTQIPMEVSQISQPQPVAIIHAPMELSRPRTRPREAPQLAIEPVPHQAPQPPPPAKHPADPRSHWVPDPQQEVIQLPSVPPEEIPSTWSPHLHPDRRVEHPRRKRWQAPSLSGSVEWAFGRRNIQVYAFCLGFLIPLTWIIASFIPLPPKPSEFYQDGSDVEQAINERVALKDELVYENARWWRNLNRCLSPLGLAIVTVIITLSVLGTRGAL
ncbi:hypothetical protein FQN54_008564 [Arachnomyces sp. PD_36]|nr:hypothetical protein FQN54_008564 [Arachnomyces sp. PD_36]